MSDALSDALFAIDSGADAIILQDLGLSELIRKARPSAILHASTQMGIHNLEGAIIAKQLGFTRVILSRECTLSEIKRIKNGVDIEVECFVQGALCIAFPEIAISAVWRPGFPVTGESVCSSVEKSTRLC